MKGLELSKLYYKEYGEAMLKSKFGDIFDRLTVGLVGEGSECFGYDDELSKDHDFEAGFCIFLSSEDEEEYGFKLMRAYSALPKEFMGVKREKLSPVGGNRRGVLITEEFYQKIIGSSSAPERLSDWFKIPEYALATATNGEIFKKGEGEFLKIRDALKGGFPEDIRKKKIAARLASMAQSGQYNYERSIKRKDLGAASISLFEFTKNAVSLIYLLNNAYEPFYKWAFRGIKDLSKYSFLGDKLEELITKNDGDKTKEIEVISHEIAHALIDEGLSNNHTINLETQALIVTDKIEDGTIRNMHVLEGI